MVITEGFFGGNPSNVKPQQIMKIRNSVEEYFDNIVNKLIACNRTSLKVLTDEDIEFININGGKLLVKDNDKLKKLSRQAENDANLNWLDTSMITSMKGLFKDKDMFNGDISGWDVSRVENMSYMFYGCSRFNGDLSKWDVSKVENMSYMFYDCNRDPHGENMHVNWNIAGWNVSNVRDMSHMFEFTDVDFVCKNSLAKWNVSNVTDMNSMFRWDRYYCGEPCGRDDLSDWDVSNVRDMRSMFEFCERFQGDLSRWDTRSVAIFMHNNMFKSCPIKRKWMPKFAR